MRISRLLKISRPRFWLYEFGTYLVGLVIGASFINSNDYIALFIFGLFFLIPANIYIYAINDIYDYETDKLNVKKGDYEALVTPIEQSKLWQWILATNLPFVIAGFMLELSLPAWFWLIAFWFFAGFYSAPPIRAKTKPIIDSLFSGAHYVATGVFAYVLVSGLDPNWLAITGAMLWTTAMHIYSAIPDIQADKEAGMKTFAILLGARNTILLCTICYGLSAAILALFTHPVIGIILFLPYVWLMYQSDLARSDYKKLFALYKKFPLLNAIVGMTLFFIFLLY
jgi:4-hydroxybenzoate polyprenyltransferase